MADFTLDGEGVPQRWTDLGNGAFARNVAVVPAAGAGATPVIITSEPGTGSLGITWNLTANPGSGLTAIVSQAAGGGTIRNVLTGFSFGFSTDVQFVPVATNVQIFLRDGPSVTGAILDQWRASIPAQTAQNWYLNASGLWIKGSQNQIMTLEFSTNIINCRQVVNAFGVQIPS